MEESPILTRCGYRCDLCLAYAPNVAAKDNRRALSDGWFALYGFRIPAEEIICDGCMARGEPRLIDKGCPVRPCAMAKGLDTCASCAEYCCEKLKPRLVDRAQLEAKLGRKLEEAEYESLVRPYESKERLDEIRSRMTKP
jgi:hypothetical protein